MDVVNPALHSVWPRQNFLPVFFLFFKIRMIPPVCPRSVPVIVGQKVDSPFASSASYWWRKWIGIHSIGPVEVLADSRGPELVQGLLAELDPPALGWEGLIPSIQLGFLQALVGVHKGGLAAGPNIRVWNSGHSSPCFFPELPVNLLLHHGCHVVKSILASLRCGHLSKHSFLYLIRPPGASPGTSASDTTMS
ncbi:unnamed protein product [Prunus armeniaca]